MPNRSSKPKRPRDPSQLAKLIVDIATGETEDKAPDEGKNPAAVELGRRGGLKGGKARSEKLSPARRKEIVIAAAKARWEKAKRSPASEPGSARPEKRRHVIQVDHED